MRAGKNKDRACFGKSAWCLMREANMDLPRIQNTQQEQNQSHNALGVPPLHHVTLSNWGGAVQANDAQKTRVAFAI